MTDSSTYVEHVADCGCPACANFDDTAVIDLGANVDGSGGTIGGKVVYDLATIIANLNRTSYPGTGIGGPGWSFEGVDARPISGDANVLYFGFYETRSELFANPYVFTNASGGLSGRNEYFQFAPFSEAQREATRKSIALWDDLIQVSFSERSATQSDLAYGNLASAPSTQAYAFLPYNYSAPQTGLAGDVWVSLSAASNLQLGNGFYGLATLIHETGHALGLQHPGGYNAAPGLSITYAVNAEFYQDTRQYSQMSYFNAEFSGGGHIDWNRLNWVYGQTPLLHDIATIQAMYGADLTTRTGNTVYGFNSNAGRDVFDFSNNSMPVISIYDAGGEDTLDLSGWDTGSEIDLNPGAFSSGGGSGIVPLDVLKARGLLPASYTEAQYLALRERYNAADGMLKDNISIAYGTTIENAIGGAGADTILGNSVANVLQGRAGNDLLNGRAGDDTLDGGVGDDTMLGGVGNDLFVVGEAGDVVTELADEGRDTVRSSIDYVLGANVEDLILVGGARNGTGNGLDNLIVANGNANRIDGGAGIDTVSYRNSNEGVKVNLQGSADGGFAKDDRLVNIEGIEGSNFADVLGGSNGNDLLFGLGGNDLLESGNGDDLLDGGDGNDELKSDNGADRLFGGAGDDFLEAGNDVDVLDGGAGNDRLLGGNGDDTLNGGVGNDRLEGGNGADIFIFGDVGGTDTIVDFKRGSDKIDLRLFDPSTDAGDQPMVFVGNAAFGNVAGQVRAYNEGGRNYVAGDLNGDGIADFVVDTGSVVISSTDLFL